MSGETEYIPAAEPAPEAWPDGEAPLLRVTGLTAGYGATGKDGMPALPVLQDVALTIGKGRAVGVIGESGCGKSTLARVIAGLTPAARGQVTLDGVPLAPGIAGRGAASEAGIPLVKLGISCGMGANHPPSLGIRG